MYICAKRKVKKQKKKMDRSGELNNLIRYMEDVVVKDYPTTVITPHYLMLAILQEKKSNAYIILSNCLTTQSFQQIETTFSTYLSTKALIAIKPGRIISYDTELKTIFENGEKEANNAGSPTLNSEHLILGILANNSPNDKIGKMFRNAGLTYKMFSEKINKENNQNIERKIIMTIPPNMDPTQMLQNMFGGEIPEQIAKSMGLNTNKKTKSKTPNIDEFCVDLNNSVEMGNIDKIIGRENETEEIIRILGRRRKNNVIIVGPEGAGKTALAENLAYKIVEGKVPNFLSDKKVISLDMTALIAGTTLRGMFEERVKGIINEIKENGNYILFIDNIGSVLADKGKNDYDISSMLSHSLENGEIQVVGTSDYKSYRSTFDKDPSLARKFQKMIIEAPTLDESIKILNGIKKYYEDFHKVKYTDSAIETCVKTASKYIPERNLPDSAIDLMDEAGAVIGTNADNNQEISNLKEQIKNIENEILVNKHNENFEKADELENNLKTNNAKLTKLEKQFKEYRKNYPSQVDENVILEIVSKKTGIPINKLSTDDKQKMATIDQRLKEEIIGQDEAIDTICKSLKRNRIGLSNNKCLASYMLIGKTAVGKTLTAKKLAKEMFGDEKALIRFDMSEYPDKTAVNKLIGSNPGYVGYEDGGLLTEAIKNKKYCVLLLDEIEKADKDVYNIFLQVLDEGCLTDNSGMKVDFKNVIVLFTSNVGAKAASDFSKGIGFNEDENKNAKKVFSKELKNTFPPEFLNRLNGIVYYNNLTDDDLKKIIELELNKSKKRIQNIGYDIAYINNQYNHEVIDYLFELVKKEKDFGARPIIRIIQTEIEDKITDMLLEKDYPKGYVFNVFKVDGVLKIQ